MIEELQRRIITKNPDWIQKAKVLSKDLKATDMSKHKRKLERKLERMKEKSKLLTDEYFKARERLNFAEVHKELHIYEIAYEMECGYWDKTLKDRNIKTETK